MASTRGELIKNSAEIIHYSTALITALQEALDYKPGRHHNFPPPSLRIDDPDYFLEVRKLIIELKRLNSLLEIKVAGNVEAAEETVTRLQKHFDIFLSAYAKALGTGAAGLTIATVTALLYRAGVATDVVDTFWQHWKSN